MRHSRESLLVGPFDRNQELAAEPSVVTPVATRASIGRLSIGRYWVPLDVSACRADLLEQGAERGPHVYTVSYTFSRFHV